MARNRRSFLKAAGVTAAVASAAPFGLSAAVGGEAGQVVAAAPPPRSAAAGRFVLELEGKVVDVLVSAGGGFPFGTVAEFQSGGAQSPDKFISGVGIDDLVLEVGAGLSAELRMWIAETLAGKGPYRSGAVHVMDFDMNVQSTLEFYDALVRSVTFPECDGSSRDPAVLQLTLALGGARFRAGTGSLTLPALLKQKQWLASNFRLTIPGLPTGRVSKVEALTVKQKVVEVREGTDRLPPVLVPGKLEYPNVVATFSAFDSQPWFSYFENFVINATGSELNGTLEYLAPDLTSQLLTLQFQNLGIFKCAPARSDGGPNSFGQFTAQMYMEGLLLPAVQ